MQRATALFELPDGSAAELSNGDIIGRVWSAALLMDDPRVSEAHAMVSLRGGELWLLALRRRFAVRGKAQTEARLEPGMVIELADRLCLTVVTVELPPAVLAIEGPGLSRMALPAVCSLRARPRPQLSPNYEPDAPCRIWTTGDGWRYSIGEQSAPLTAGTSLVVEGATFTVSLMPLAGQGQSPTRMSGGVEPPLRIVAAFDTVQLHRGDESPLVLGGISARILSELASMGGPASWEVLARQIWPEDADTWSLRKRWDVALARLRARLREARVRNNLIHADGTGQFELVLQAGDTLVDKT